MLSRVNNNSDIILLLTATWLVVFDSKNRLSTVATEAHSHNTLEANAQYPDSLYRTSLSFNVMAESRHCCDIYAQIEAQIVRAASL